MARKRLHTEEVVKVEPVDLTERTPAPGPELTLPFTWNLIWRKGGENQGAGLLLSGSGVRGGAYGVATG